MGFLSAGDTIHVAFGANGNQAWDFFKTDFNIVRDEVREQTVGNFRDDFLTSEPSEFGWKYYWNAPNGWSVDGTPGNLLTGPIGDLTHYLPLEFTGSQWTADGDLDGLNSAPDYYLRLGPGKGHVGSGFRDPLLPDRFAIAAYTVEHSGLYGLSNSFISVSAKSSDGVEVVVHDENGKRLTDQQVMVGGGQTRGFDTRLGYLQKGETVYIGFGGNQNHSFDSFETDFSIVRILPRPAPDLSLLDHDGEIVSVNESRYGDNGAIPNDNLDDWQAIQNALTYARDNNASEIHFAPGTYNLSSHELAELEPLFTIGDMNDLVINGNGSTLIVDDYTQPLFYTRKASNIIFQNLTIDYAELVPAIGRETNDLYRPLTFTQGIISDLDHDENTFTLTVNINAFVAPDESFEIANGIGYGYAVDQFVDGRLKTGTDWHYPTRSVEAGETPTRFKITSSGTEGLANGDRYILQRRNNVAMFGVYNGSSNISFVNVTAYAAPSVLFSSIYSESVNIINSHAKIRPDDWPSTPNTQRWKSINADAVHIQSNRTGVWVEDSTFNGTSDDVMNFYTRPMTVIEIISDTEFTLATLAPKSIQNLPADSIQVGDHLSFFNPLEGRVIKEVKIVAVTEKMVPDPENPDRILRMQTVTLDQPVTDVIIGDGTDRDGYLNETTVFNNDAMRGSLVQDSVLSNGRRYGNYLMTNNAQLVDNIYEGLSDEAITANNEPGWPLGPFSNDILIQGNQFINNGHSRNFLRDEFHTGTVTFKAARYVDPYDPNNSTKLSDHLVDERQYVFSNVKILDNVFYHWNKSAVSVRNAQHVTIAGNSISGGRAMDANGNPHSPFDIHFTNDVTLDSNAYVGSAEAVNSSETSGLSESETRNVHDGGLSAWLKFDRGAILSDSSGKGSVTKFNDAGISDGIFDSAPIFNSTNSVTVDDGKTTDISTRTISLWVEVKDVNRSPEKQVIYQEGDAGDGLNIYVENGQLYVGAWAESSFATFLNTSVESNKWYHVALVIDSQIGKIRGYLDGNKFDAGNAALVRATQAKISLGRVAAHGTRFHTGVVLIGDSHGLQGKINDVRIYDRVLGDAEIAVLSEIY